MKNNFDHTLSQFQSSRCGLQQRLALWQSLNKSAKADCKQLSNRTWGRAMGVKKVILLSYKWQPHSGISSWHGWHWEKLRRQKVNWRHRKQAEGKEPSSFNFCNTTKKFLRRQEVPRRKDGERCKARKKQGKCSPLNCSKKEIWATDSKQVFIALYHNKILADGRL